MECKKMKHIFKASALFSKLRNRSWTQHLPNTTTDGHNDDQPNMKKGLHPKVPDTNLVVNNVPYQYHWNSLGLRGPEPNKDADRKILAIGNSATLGCGVPVEYSFIHKLAQHYNADYINLSDNFVLTDTIEYAREIISWYKPNFIYISDFRFIDVSTFLIWHFRKTYDFKEMDKTEMYQMMIDSMKKTVNMYEDTIKLYAPTSKIIWDINYTESKGRRTSFGDHFTNLEIIDCLTLPHYTYSNNDIFKDLGRDARHPGILSHEWMTKRLIKIIGEKLNG
jgi:hypothetical protein